MKTLKITAWVIAGGFLIGAPLKGIASDVLQQNAQRQSDQPQTLLLAQQEAKSKQSDSKTDGVQKPDKMKEKVAVYKPPRRGRPWRTQGGGTRGQDNCAPSIAVLAPNDHTGLTGQEQPSLYWFTSAVCATAIEFTIMEERGVAPLLEVQLPAPTQPGIQKVNLADHEIRLEKGKRYQWSVALVYDPQHRSKDVVAMGGIERMDPSAEVSDDLAKASFEQVPEVYTEAGLWYDAVMAISDLIDTTSNNVDLRKQRASLLKQVQLREVAAHETASLTGSQG